MTVTEFRKLADEFWGVADLLRGPYRPPQYERVMLPMTVLRRFDAVLQPTKDAVLKRYEALQKSGKAKGEEALDAILSRVAGGGGVDMGFHNHCKYDFAFLKGDPDNVAHHLSEYIAGFSKNVREIFDRFDFGKEIERLEEANRLYLIVAKFAEINLHPDRVDNHTMGHVFEDLIRRFNEAANETAGDHFTPREVIRLMVSLLISPDEDAFVNEPSVILKICDPACGTGGMLSESQARILEHNAQARVYLYGQDYNARSYAVAASDLLIKGFRQSESRIVLGNTLLSDPFDDQQFDYLLANPPFGVDWKAEQPAISKRGRFGPYTGKLPRINDGALLFLLYMIGKFQPYEPKKRRYGTRVAIVFNGSPLFTGGAGSGESEIRRWIIENDWLEAIVALPEQMFYNTGIGTYIWVVTNRKEDRRKGTIQMIDARERWVPMRRSLGDKRRELTPEIIDAITLEHGRIPESDTSKVFPNEHFGYRRVTVERPLRLRFEITQEAKESFLHTYPEKLDLVIALEEFFGGEPSLDWNAVWAQVQDITDEQEARWTAAERKLFRLSFTTVDPEAEPVVAKHNAAFTADADALFPGQSAHSKLSNTALAELLGFYTTANTKKGKFVTYEADPALRDFENIPLQEDVLDFFQREVLPFVPDAWVNAEAVDEQDGGIGKVGYEINFNREFFRYQPPRALEAIDEELKGVEARIVSILNTVTA